MPEMKSRRIPLNQMNNKHKLVEEETNDISGQGTGG